jgi:hypothetical protein
VKFCADAVIVKPSATVKTANKAFIKLSFFITVFDPSLLIALTVKLDYTLLPGNGFVSVVTERFRFFVILRNFMLRGKENQQILSFLTCIRRTPTLGLQRFCPFFERLWNLTTLTGRSKPCCRSAK